MPARDVVSSETVESYCCPRILIVGRFRAILVEVDSDIGIEGFDGRPGVGTNAGVTMLVGVDEVELRQFLRIAGGQGGASAVIDEERLDELARRGGLRG